MTKFILFLIAIISTIQVHSKCYNTIKTCELVHTRPWSKDLSNQCTMMLYHCTERSCDGVPKTYTKKKKICDPIKCKPYENYDSGLKCCVKNNIKWKIYKDQQAEDQRHIPRANTNNKYIMSIRNIERVASAKLVLITDKNRHFCQNSKAKNGAACLMTYYNAKYYCKENGKELPSIKSYIDFQYEIKAKYIFHWMKQSLFIISPMNNTGEDLQYNYENTQSFEFELEGLNKGIWLKEYCYSSESNAFDKNGKKVMSPCKFLPSNGTFKWNILPLRTGTVLCKKYTKTN